MGSINVLERLHVQYVGTLVSQKRKIGIYIVNHLRFQEIWVGLFAKPLSFPHHKLFSLLDSDDQGFPVPQEEVHPHVQDVRVKVAHLKKEM